MVYLEQERNEYAGIFNPPGGRLEIRSRRRHLGLFFVGLIMLRSSASRSDLLSATMSRPVDALVICQGMRTVTAHITGADAEHLGHLGLSLTALAADLPKLPVPPRR